MISPNIVLPIATAKQYFPTIPDGSIPDAIWQQLVDDIMAQINVAMSVDLSAGQGVAVTQSYKWQQVPMRILRLAVPADLDQPVSVVQGINAEPLQPQDLVVYTNMIHRYPGYSSFYYFDRVTPKVVGFLPPTVVTYTPREDVFRNVRQAMINILKLKLDGSDMTGEISTFSKLKRTRDDFQEVEYQNPASNDAVLNAAIDAEIQKLINMYKGPRLG